MVSYNSISFFTPRLSPESPPRRGFNVRVSNPSVTTWRIGILIVAGRIAELSATVFARDTVGFVIDMRLRHILERAINVDDPLVLGLHGELLEYRTVVYPTVDYLDAMVLVSLSGCTKVNIPASIKKEISAQVLSLGKSMWNDTGNEVLEKVMPIAVEVVVRNL